MLARQIFRKLTTLQRNWAGFMQFHSEKLSRGWLKSISLTVLLIGAAYSTYLILDGLLSLSQSKAPSSIHGLWPFDPNGTKRKLRIMSGFQFYLDSLENSVVQDSLNHVKQNP